MCVYVCVCEKKNKTKKSKVIVIRSARSARTTSGHLRAIWWSSFSQTRVSPPLPRTRRADVASWRSYLSILFSFHFFSRLFSFFFFLYGIRPQFPTLRTSPRYRLSSCAATREKGHTHTQRETRSFSRRHNTYINACIIANSTISLSIIVYRAKKEYGRQVKL